MRRAVPHSLVPAIAAGCAIAPLVAWLFLSHNGFCFGQRRFLSDEEYFDVAISHIIHVANYPVDIPGGYKYVKQIPYKDVAEFRASNPDCCKVVRHNSGLEVGHVSFEDELFGLAARSIYLTYTLNYLDEGGNQQSVTTAAQMVIGNCGQILNTAARI